MAKSLLKTLMVQLLDVDRDDIIFDDNDMSIKIDNSRFMKMNLISVTNDMILLGTIFSDEGDLNDIHGNSDLTEDELHNLFGKCMNQIITMLARKHPNRSTLICSFPSNYIISQALTSTIFPYEGPWRLIDTITTPVSIQQKNIFIAQINQ